MNRISIGIKLAIAFCFVVSILIVVGWLGLNRMGRINADLNDINYRRWAKVQLAQEAVFYSNRNSRLRSRHPGRAPGGDRGFARPARG